MLFKRFLDNSTLKSNDIWVDKCSEFCNSYLKNG